MKTTRVNALKEELSSYFQQHSIRYLPTGYHHPLTNVFENFMAEHPDASRFAVKAEMYRRISEYFTPKLFDNSPFYFQTDIYSPDWESSASSPAFFLNEHMPPIPDMDAATLYSRVFRNGLGWAGVVDKWHYCPDYTRIINEGFKGIHDEILRELPSAKDETEKDFLNSALEGILAMKRCADKFAEAAENALQSNSLTPEQRENWTRIAETARRIPWEAPQTFYEGLETLLFVREVGNSFDGIHIDIVGHPDRQLGRLYRQDIASGRLTKDDAYLLIRQFLLVNDCKMDNHEIFEEATQSKRDDDTNERRRPLAVVNEINATLVLGGCEEDGSPLCEELTLMFLRAHREDGLIFPKPLCRFCATSSSEYLRELNCNFLASRSVLALVNDDAIIPAQVAAGKSIEDARRYQIGGCWEITIEGREDSSGVTTYFNLGKLMELTVNPPSELAGILCSLDGADSFEDVQERFLRNLSTVMNIRAHGISVNGPTQIQANPCPLFSAMLADCIKNHKDYTYGGGRYNPHANPFFAFANAVDSLMAIKTICFGSKDAVPLQDYIASVRNNWEGAEQLRQRAIHSPFWGDNQPETNAVAERLHTALGHVCEGIPNERGGKWQTAFYVYREMITYALATGATPDGRHSGDWLGQGITPSRLHHSDSITDACLALGNLDCRLAPGNRLFDLNFPLNASSYESLETFERVAANQGIGMLQINCVSREQLLDAQVHPENHGDLIVRICGYSARFVTLPKLWQDEFIARAIYS